MHQAPGRDDTVDPTTPVRPTREAGSTDGLQQVLAPYGVQHGSTVEPRRRGGRHARPADRRAAVAAAIAVLLLGGASAAALATGGTGPQVPPATPPALEVEAPAVTDPLLPGATVTGAVRLTNPRSRPVQVEDVAFGAPTSEACSNPGVSLAATLPPTPESPVTVPAGGTASLSWTAYMDGTGDDACQGAPLASTVSLDGERAGTVTLTAGELAQPPAPTGGPTTGTRAAVRWSASTAAAPGWVVERAVAGTVEWQPACGSSTGRPVRALACTDTGLAPSTAYVYRVTLRSGRWQATSRPSRPTTTQAAVGEVS